MYPMSNKDDRIYSGTSCLWLMQIEATLSSVAEPGPLRLDSTAPQRVS